MGPMLRFKANDGSDFPDWEEKTLGEVCFINPRADALEDEFYYMDLGCVDRGMWKKPEVVSKKNAPSRAQRVAQIGDVFFQSVRPYNMGHYHYTNKMDKQVVASTGYIQARMKNGCNAFLYQMFYEERFNVEVSMRCTGSNYPAITANKFSEIVAPFPSLPEQRKIADFLSAVDAVIAAQQTEVDAWEQRKKGVMQRLFSQEVKFKADDGSEFPAWEERAFWDVLANLTNNTLSRECLNTESGQARNIHYGDVLIKYGAVVDVQKDCIPFINLDVECNRWDCLKNGDVVIADTAEDETVGKAVEISNIGSDVVYSGLHTIACRPKEKFAPGYLGYYINSMSYHDQLHPYMQGIKVTSVSKSNIGLTHILIPSLSEQRKIADCLASMDEVIQKAKSELVKWQELKKGLLQQMFV